MGRIMKEKVKMMATEVNSQERVIVTTEYCCPLVAALGTVAPHVDWGRNTLLRSLHSVQNIQISFPISRCRL